MFGGTEVVWTSRRQTSSLSDISIALADYFDTGSAGALDVTPSDLLVGMNILAYEQRIQKQERFAQLQADLEQSLVSRDRRRTAADGAEVDQVVSLHSNSEVDVEEGIEPVVSIRSVATGTFEGDDSGNEGSARENSDTGKGRRRQLVIDPNDDWNLQLRRTKSNSRAYFKVATRRRLKKENEFDRRVILEGAHYLRLAHAVYGHMMYLLQHPCSAPCCLAVAFFACHGSCNSCKSNDGNGAVVVGDNLCRCNELGFLHVAGLDREDLAYVSFKTGIRTCPYGIVVDREKKTVVLVIRGTFSLESTVTDLNIRPELLEDYGDKCEAFNECLVKGEYCHSGILHCALFVYKDLERHKILDKLLLGDSPRFPGFTLIVTGHSLGAGVGAVLSLMLRNRFHALQCLCFSPPGCVMSEGISSHDFMTSYILDSDIVPRLSLHSVVSLRNDVLKMIARIKVPKHVAFSQERLKRRANGDLDLVYRRESIPESAFYRRLCDFQEHQEKLQKERDNRDIKLVIPGTLIHIVKHITHVKSGFFDTRQTVIYTPVWAARDDFAEIQLTKSLVSDHDPEKLLLSLTSLTDFFPLNQ